MSRLEARLQELNQDKIDLGLDRLRQVLNRLQISLPETIITVGGTNGKGSTVAALAALSATRDISYGAFTSPHIHRFNERINVNGQLATDDEILEAFSQIDQARGDIALSYFEYAFLAAMLVFAAHRLEVVFLEVGLGGRLDATNVLDADAVIITTVDLDHMSWLGDDIEHIGVEKAGIIRSGQTVVYGAQSMPDSIQHKVTELQADLNRLNQDFVVVKSSDGWQYTYQSHHFGDLPQPALPGEWQLDNFASALTVLLARGWTFTGEAVRQALLNMRLNGRLQLMHTAPEVLADVAHNRQSAAMLAQWLQDHPVSGHTRAVFSVLADKQFGSWIHHFTDLVDHWFTFELDGSRALPADALKTGMAEHVALLSHWESASQAYQMARAASQPNDRIVVFGSFHVLDEVFKPAQPADES
jgi:dihydrofolate synthase/folylpolyglutamate synthase